MRGAILESPFFPTQPKVADLEWQFGRFVNAAGCAGSLDELKCLRSKDTATLQAAGVVVLSSLAAGVGAISLGASNFLMAPLLSLVSWYVWAYIIYFIGAKLFPEPTTKADHGELLRTIGFSSAPGLIRVFGFTPELMSITFIGAAIWMLVAMIVAVRQALDYESTWRAIGVVVIGFLVQAIFLVMLLRIFGPS